MRKLDRQAVEAIALGAAVLGTGGGGDPTIGKLMVLQALEEYGPVTLIDCDELDDDALVIPAQMMGAPTVAVEKIPGGDEVITVLRMMEACLGRTMTATMPIEVGGINSMIPLAVAARIGVPVVDADAMGRAFPEAQMTTFYLDGLGPFPVMMADEKGNRVWMRAVDMLWVERFSRSIAVDMGGSAAIADVAVTGKEVKRSAIPGTLTLAERIGRLLIQDRRGEHVAALLDLLNGMELFRGKVTDVARRTASGFTKGRARLHGTGPYAGRRMEVAFQNEYLVALEEGKPLAMTPDLIVVLDAETGWPITTETLKYGMRTVVAAFPCHPKWRTEKGVATAGPRYFGYDFDYVPVEVLAEKRRTDESST